MFTLSPLFVYLFIFFTNSLNSLTPNPIFFLTSSSQEFENLVVDYLSRLNNSSVIKKENNIMEEFLDERLFTVSKRPWFDDMVNCKASNLVPEDYTWHQKKKFFKRHITTCGVIYIFSNWRLAC